MAVIKQDDLIQSVADALQYISYYHPVDFIQAVHEAYEREESKAAKDAMAQILINSRMCATGHRPICQDTGIVTVFVKVGMNVSWDGATMSLDDMINEGVRRAYNNPDNVLRASILADPAGKRTNTKDNTPAVIHYQIVPGDKVEVDVAAKGGGSEPLRSEETDQDQGLSDPCGQPAGLHDPQLRRNPSRALRARRQWPGRAESAADGCLPGNHLGSGRRRAPRQPRHRDPGRRAELEER
jgi:hypothetical protein